MMRAFAFAGAAFVGAIPALAIDHVVPPAYQGVVGTHVFQGPLSAAARTYQLLIHADELTALAGSSLTGITWRSLTSAATAWPTNDTTYAAYDIYLSGSVRPEDRSFTFAENIVGPQTLVRSGPLTIPAGVYGFGSSPNPFGPAIEFDQPWHYTGGHLLVEIRHTVSDGGSRAVDAIGTAITGYGSQFSALWSGSHIATSTTSPGNFSITQFTATGGAPACYANCDDSTTAPALNVADFTCFLQRFAAAEAYANCDDSTTAPTLNVADFTCFLQRFAAGCP